jgi:glycosyltransferase involved in cell wall biosynthesis
MKILHAVAAYYPFQERGGPVFKVGALAAGLARRGHEVTVVTPDLGLEKHAEIQPQLRKHAFGWRLEREGVEIIYLSTVTQYRALTLNPSVMGFCRTLLPRFDLVHCYGLYDFLGPAVGYFCRSADIPYIVEPMGMYRPIDRSLWLKRLWHGTLGKGFLRGASKIVATSELEERELLDAGFPQTQVVVRYNGIDPALLPGLPSRGSFRAKWGLPRSEPLVLFLSRIIPRKGVDLLIDAFARACTESGRLMIAGPEGERGYLGFLEKRARESGAGDRILFCGPLYDEDKKAALRDADIFALPSRYENFANVAAEAMACGVPVIVTDACGISPLVDGIGGLVIAREQEALTQALSSLIHDEALYARLKEGCSRVADQLAWGTLTGQMERHYQDAVRGEQGAAAAPLRLD